MNQSAKLYITAVLGLGSLALGASVLNLSVAQPALFALLATLAILGGALKMRVPGVDGNISLSFLPMILSGVLISLPETILLSIAATLVQGTVGVKKRRTVQIAFNCSALSLSMVAGSLLGGTVAGQGVPLIQLGLVGAGFYVMNSVLVTTVIGLVENKSLLSIWDECLRVYLPYFATGLGCALMAFTGATSDERRSLQYPGIAVLPMMLLARHYFKTFGSGANQST
jgi:hypothetical protein